MRKTLKTVMTLIVLAAPKAALACPVCFGNSDAPMAKATNMGIIAMLVVVAGMLASFAAFFIYLNRRARMVNAAEARHALSGIDSQEGTVQC